MTSHPPIRLSARFVCLLVIIAILAPAPAFAYIDPGTGSFVIQGVIALVVGAGMTVKIFWKRIKSALTGKHEDEDDDA